MANLGCIFLLVSIAGMVILPSEAIRCYHCVGRGCTGGLTSCPGSSATCFTTTVSQEDIGDLITKTCGITSDGCGKTSTILSIKTTLECCYYDGCNSASTSTISLAALTLISLVSIVYIIDI